jgi:hypothetical protein
LKFHDLSKTDETEQERIEILQPGTELGKIIEGGENIRHY